jgi:hypothetical protein
MILSAVSRTSAFASAHGRPKHSDASSARTIGRLLFRKLKALLIGTGKAGDLLKIEQAGYGIMVTLDHLAFGIKKTQSALARKVT